MKLNINGQKAEWLETHLTVYGSEGIYELEVQFADDPNVGASWDDLAKKAVYKNSALESTCPDGIYADIVDGVAQVPAAILSAPGLLYVGVMGEAAGVAMPTVWASPLAISPGCGEGQDAPPVVYDAARNAIKYGENAEVYAEGGYLVLEVEGTLDDPILVRSDEHTDGAKDYADAAALSSNFASARAKDAEAYAIGSRDGEPITSDDPAYHNNALYYAGQAAGSASDAHADAVAAHDDAGNAHADAQAAAGSASDASGYATAAGNAKTAAQSAQGYAEAAQTGAETAEGNAEAWSVGQRDGVDVPATDPAYNNNAKYYAGQAAASAAQAAQTAASIAADFAYLTAPDGISQVGLYQDREATPGAIVTFADGADGIPVKSASFGVEPVQDRHGYDHPWPAGGGKNKLGVAAGSVTIGDVTFTVDANGVITSSGKASETVVYTFATSIKLAAGSYLYNGITGGSNDTFCMRIYGDDGNQIGSDLFSGDLAFTLAADATNMFCRIIVRTGQSASGLVFKPMIRLATEEDASYAPYENICPITGHTAAAITVNGVNQWDEEWEVGSINNTTGELEPTSSTWRCKNIISVKPSETYFFRTASPNSSIRFYWYDRNMAFLSSNTVDNSAITSPSNAAFLRIRGVTAGGASYTPQSVSVNYPATDHAYHASAGKTISVLWQTAAGTVYGGTLAYLGGQMWRLTVDRAEVDLGGKTWSVSSATVGGVLHRFGYAKIDGMTGNGTATTAATNAICSALKVIPRGNYAISGTVYAGETGIAAEGEYDYAYLPSLDDASKTGLDWASAMSGVQLVYTLATPLVYDLTADDVKTLLGNNVIFADTGDIEELTYRTSENSRTIVLGTSLSGALEAIAGFIGVSE